MTMRIPWMAKYKLTELQTIVMETAAERVWAISHKYNMVWEGETTHLPYEEDILIMYKYLTDMLLKFEGTQNTTNAAGLYVSLIDVDEDKKIVKFDYGMSIRDDVTTETWAKVKQDGRRGEEKRKRDKALYTKPEEP